MFLVQKWSNSHKWRTKAHCLSYEWILVSSQSAYNNRVQNKLRVYDHPNHLNITLAFWLSLLPSHLSIIFSYFFIFVFNYSTFFRANNNYHSLLLLDLYHMNILYMITFYLLGERSTTNNTLGAVHLLKKIEYWW